MCLLVTKIAVCVSVGLKKCSRFNMSTVRSTFWVPQINFNPINMPKAQKYKAYKNKKKYRNMHLLT